MWFKLAGATFTNNLGTMDSISKSYMMDYSGLTGLQASPGSVSYATDSTPDATITFTVKSGYVFKSGSTVTASGGASKTYTASADIAAGSSFTMALTGINNKVTFTGAAELVSGGGGSEGGGEPTDPTPDVLPDGYTALPTTKYALGVTSTGTGRVSANNAKRFSTADDTVANGILIPNGKTLHLIGLASGTYPLRLDYIYCTGNVTCPPSGSTTAIEGLVGTASNYDTSNYFPLNKTGADTIDITNNYGADYYFWFGFAGQTLNEGILAAYDTYTLGYKID